MAKQNKIVLDPYSRKVSEREYDKAWTNLMIKVSERGLRAPTRAGSEQNHFTLAAFREEVAIRKWVDKKKPFRDAPTLNLLLTSPLEDIQDQNSEVQSHGTRTSRHGLFSPKSQAENVRQSTALNAKLEDYLRARDLSRFRARRSQNHR